MVALLTKYILCTGGAYYVPYTFLLISISFVMWGELPSRAIKFLYAPAPPSPTVLVLKPCSWALVHKTTYALGYRLDAIAQGQKTLDFQSPTPLPLALVMNMLASNTLCTGLYKS